MQSSSGYLRSHDRYNDRLRIGPEETTLAPIHAEACAGLPLLGLYTAAGGERLLFYRWEGELRLRFGDLGPIALTECEAAWEASAGESAEVQFRLTRGGAAVIERRYPLPESIRDFADDPTPFAEPEDFDLLLLVANVLTDPERASRIFAPEW